MVTKNKQIDESPPMENPELKKPFTDRELSVLGTRMHHFANENFFKALNGEENNDQMILSKAYLAVADAIVDLKMALNKESKVKDVRTNH